MRKVLLSSVIGFILCGCTYTYQEVKSGKISEIMTLTVQKNYAEVYRNLYIAFRGYEGVHTTYKGTIFPDIKKAELTYQNTSGWQYYLIVEIEERTGQSAEVKIHYLTPYYKREAEKVKKWASGEAHW